MVGLTNSVNISTIAACLCLIFLFGQDSQLNAQVTEVKASPPTQEEIKHNSSTDTRIPDKPASKRIPTGNIRNSLMTFDNHETELQFVDTPLVDALNIIGELHRLKFFPDVKAIKEAGIALDEPVNIFISGVTLRDGLDLILLPLGLDYVAEHGVIHVTTKAIADQKLKIEIHTNTTSLQQNPEELIELITTLVEPETWTQIGGRGVIKPYKDGIIILQTQRNHRKISEFLAALKEVE